MRRAEQRDAEALARFLVATQLYAGATELAVAWWGVWLDQVHAAGFSIETADLVASADARHFGCALWDDGPDRARAVDVMLQQHGVSAAERDRMFGVAAVARERHGVLGLWAAQARDGFEGGWGIAGDFDMSFVAAMAGAQAEALAEMCAVLECDEVTQLRRTVADGTDYWDVELPLGDLPLERAWAVVARAYAPALVLPPRLEQWLSEPAPPRATLTVRLATDASLRFGLGVPVGSGRDVAAGLAAAGIDERADEHLAAVAGAVGRTPARLVVTYDGELDLWLEL